MTDETIDVTVSLTARVHAAEGGGGYDLTAENGQVTIKKVGSTNRTPVISIDDLERAVKAIRGSA
jgi:hypothetical protein